MKIGNCEIDADISWALTENGPLLLGRKGIFDAFHITFKQDQGLVVLKKT